MHDLNLFGTTFNITIYVIQCTVCEQIPESLKKQGELNVLKFGLFSASYHKIVPSKFGRDYFRELVFFLSFLEVK
jgi:hypothetical protein